MDPAMPAAALHHEERSEGGTDSAACPTPDADNPLPQEGEETVALKQNKLPQRRALKCRLCDGKLLLNPLMLRQHIASKKHVKRCIGTYFAKLQVCICTLCQTACVCLLCRLFV
jgi:hypothetical protein